MTSTRDTTLVLGIDSCESRTVQSKLGAIHKEPLYQGNDRIRGVYSQLLYFYLIPSVAHVGWPENEDNEAQNTTLRTISRTLLLVTTTMRGQKSCGELLPWSMTLHKASMYLRTLAFPTFYHLS